MTVGNPPSVVAGQATLEEAVAAAASEALAFLRPPDLSYTVREGRALFRHYCATCHGEEGRGDGFNSYNLDPKPRDLADPAFQDERSDAELVAIIRIGGGAAGLSTGMPPWGHTVTERKIQNLVAYVRALAPAGAEGGP